LKEIDEKNIIRIFNRTYRFGSPFGAYLSMILYNKLHLNL